MAHSGLFPLFPMTTLSVYLLFMSALGVVAGFSLSTLLMLVRVRVQRGA